MFLLDSSNVATGTNCHILDCIFLFIEVLFIEIGNDIINENHINHFIIFRLLTESETSIFHQVIITSPPWAFLTEVNAPAGIVL